MNEIARIEIDELDNLAQAAMRGGGRMLKFRKGDYFCDGQEVAKGTQFIAHVVGWTQQWVKFVDRRPVERRTYRIIKGERAPERDQMPDNDEESRKNWPLGIDGKNQADPWSLQYLLPMEEAETGDAHIFVTSTAGGKIAVEELVNKYTAQRRRHGSTVGQPLVRIQKTIMPNPKYGPTVRPVFEVVSFDSGGSAPIRELDQEVLTHAEEMDDEIPF